MTPDDGVCYNDEVKYMDIKTSNGHIGLQEGITPMIAAIENGMFKIKVSNDSWISGLLCKGTLYVDKENGIKVFTSAFKWMEEVNVNELEKNIQLLKEKVESNPSTHQEYTDWMDQLLINQNLLDAFKNQ